MNISFRLYFDGQSRLYCILTYTQNELAVEKAEDQRNNEQATKRRTNNLSLFFFCLNRITGEEDETHILFIN